MMDDIARLLQGEPFHDFEIIDAHDHLGPWKAFCVHGGGTIERLLKRADRLGIQRLFITAHAAIGPDYILGNNLVLDAMERFPERVYGYVTVNPNYPEDMAHELERCFTSNSGFRGIKLHPDLHGRPVDCALYAPAFDYAQEHKLPVLIHTWSLGNVMDIDHLAGIYPDAAFIIAHMGGDPKVMETALKVLNRRENVYGDVAISASPMGGIEFFVREAGSKKILFGTDMPFYDPCITLARVVTAEISREEKQDLLADNIKRLLMRKA